MTQIDNEFNLFQENSRIVSHIQQAMIDKAIGSTAIGDKVVLYWDEAGKCTCLSARISGSFFSVTALDGYYARNSIALTLPLS